MSVIGWFVLGFSLLGLAFIIWVPQYIIPASSSSKYDEILKVATTRNSIRSTIAQIVAGLAFVATFIQGSVNFSADYKQKADLATSDQFAKAFAQLKDTPDDAWATIGSFYILANIAESDSRYHESVYGALSQFIVQYSQRRCGIGADRDAQNTPRDAYQSLEYTIAPVLQTAIRLFVDRKQDNDTQRQFNLEGACLANADVYKAKSLSRLIMPHARFLRVNAIQAKFFDSDLRGIEAGAVHNANWDEWEKGHPFSGAWTFHNKTLPQDIVKVRADFEGAEFRYVRLSGAGFEGANLKGVQFLDSDLSHAVLLFADLTDASFRGSDLSGAWFDGANIARADFTGAKNLSLDQLLSACVREELASSIELSWPKLPLDLKRQVETAKGFKVCE